MNAASMTIPAATFRPQRGRRCGYTCELCNSQDSGLVPGVSGNAPAECICETRCEKEAVNSDCPVCSAEDADLSACKGTEQAMPLMAAAASTEETISGKVTWDNRNITTPGGGAGRHNNHAERREYHYDYRYRIYRRSGYVFRQSDHSGKRQSDGHCSEREKWYCGRQLGRNRRRDTYHKRAG